MKTTALYRDPLDGSPYEIAERLGFKLKERQKEIINSFFSFDNKIIQQNFPRMFGKMFMMKLMALPIAHQKMNVLIILLNHDMARRMKDDLLSWIGKLYVKSSFQLHRAAEIMQYIKIITWGRLIETEPDVCFIYGDPSKDMSGLLQRMLEENTRGRGGVKFIPEINEEILTGKRDTHIFYFGHEKRKEKKEEEWIKSVSWEHMEK